MVEKRKIIQVWDKDIDDVIMYCQVLFNKDTKEEVEIKAHTLNDLNIQVDNQIKQWENSK